MLPHLPEDEPRGGECAPVSSAVSAGGRPARLSVPFEVAASRRHPSATERRVQIARCRALRSEIGKFEAEFRASHGGHEPKSSSD